MSPFKWFLLFAFLVSAIWLWPLYMLVVILFVGAYFDTGKGARRTRKSTYKPFKLKRPKPTVYKAPRYPKAKPYNKGRLLKSGMRQHYRNGRWWPPARKDNTPD